MIPLDTGIAAKLLERDRYRYLMELPYLCREPPYCQHIFGDASKPSVVMLVRESGDPEYGVRPTFIGYDARFLKECVAWLHRSYEELTLISMDGQVLMSPAVSKDFEVELQPVLRSYICTSLATVPPVTANVVKLTEGDRAAVERYPQEAGCEIRVLKRHFEACVLEAHGEILVIKEQEEILGYLSCHHDYFENHWGIYFIHVREDTQAQGLGTQLAAAYARDKLAQGQVPFYEYARNAASERVALKAGFVCCREEFRAKARRKGGGY